MIIHFQVNGKRDLVPDICTGASSVSIVCVDDYCRIRSIHTHNAFHGHDTMNIDLFYFDSERDLELRYCGAG